MYGAERGKRWKTVLNALFRPYLSLLILVPDNGEMTMETLSEMVRSVNRTQIEAEEFLADHAYYYDAKEGRLLY